MYVLRNIIFTAILMLLVFGGESVASEVSVVGTEQDWVLYTTKDNDKTICYIGAFPYNKEGTYKKRGDPYLLVTHIHGDVDEVSISAGYPYAHKSSVDVLIDDKYKYSFFTMGEIAWAGEIKTDKEIVKRMQQGLKLKVNAVSQKNTKSYDTYSLRGFTKSYQQMKKLCGKIKL